ncbi:MAG: hypothetical protein V3V33_16320 [Candidatus Lokiarchaeia archaeon]
MIIQIIDRSRFHYIWRNKWITSEAKSIEDFIKAYEQSLEV